MRLAIIGTGPMAQGICALAMRSGALASGTLEIRMCSRRASAGDEIYLEGLPKTPIMETRGSLEWSDVVILAVQASQLPGICASYGDVLSSKVVVDITNPSRSDMGTLAATVSAGSGTRRASDNNSSIDVVVCATGKDDGTAGSSTTRPSSAAHALALMLSSNAPPPGFDSAKITTVGPVLISAGAPAVVKALNNVSAYSLLKCDPVVDHLKTVVASDSKEAARVFRDILTSMGIECRVVPTLAYANRMEGWHRTLFSGWQMPTILMGVTFVLLEIFAAIRYNHYDHAPWYHMTMWITNKAAGWVSLWGLLYCYLPGLAITYLQLLQRVPSFKLWPWVQRWMDARKQIGLLALLLMLLHLALSTYLWMPAYYSKLWEPTSSLALAIGPAGTTDKYGLAAAASLPRKALNLTMLAAGGGSSGNATALPAVLAKPVSAITLKSQLTWQGEVSMLLGILAGITMGLVGMTSMPSITHRLNWREWVLAQSWLGWFSFCAATAHTLVLGISWWPTAKTAWPAGIPTITLLSTAPCVIIITFKLVVMVPPVSWALARLRAGTWGRPPTSHAVYVAH